MKYNTLYVSDMDGTLLDNDSMISPRTASIISDLSRHGAMITVATARTPATVDQLMAATFTRCPAIVMTGAAMWDHDKKQMIDLRLLPTTDAATTLNLFLNYNVDPFIYTVTSPSHLDVYHVIEMNPQERSFYEARRHLALKKFHLGTPIPPEAIGKIILMFSTGKADNIIPLAEAIRNHTGCSVSCYPDNYNPDVAIIEVLAPGVSKSTAVRQLASTLGANRIVVFGDNLNDLPMMKVADLAVAVDNAFPQVKQQADIVIDRNSADSVARFIEKDYYEHL